MNRHWLHRSGRSDLILVFGGWALGAGPFHGLKGACDVLLVDDYTSLDDPLPELTQYDRVDLLSFSFGVASAAHWLARVGVRPKRLVAVSGTLFPADADHGIAPDTVRATAEHLCADSFARFCRRAGQRGPIAAIDIDAARAELYAVIDRGPAPGTTFDRVWIPDRDRIVPTQAQIAAWRRQPEVVRRIPGGHVPFRPGQRWAEWIA